MTSIRIDHQSETSAYAWQMQCDKCWHRDPVLYPGRSRQPNLWRFHLAGWAIGAGGDRCPDCVAKHPLPHDWEEYFTPERMARMRAAVDETDERKRYCLVDLNEDEIAQLIAVVDGGETRG